MIAAALLACALNVAPATMDAIIHVEDQSLNPLAIHVNKLSGRQPQASTVSEAVQIVRTYMAAGYTADLGLVQLNTGNIPKLGYTIEDAFDPCKNVAAGGRILSGFYGKAVQKFGEGQRALMSALSAYNTGDLQRRGFENGYVGKYYVNVPLPSTHVAPPFITATLTWPAATPVASIQVYVRPGLNLQGTR